MAKKSQFHQIHALNVLISRLEYNDGLHFEQKPEKMTTKYHTAAKQQAQKVKAK